MLRRDVSIGLIAVASSSALVKEVRAESCTVACYAQTSAETAAGSKPVNLSCPPGNVLRYSEPGTTNMAPAFQAALNQASQATGSPVRVPAGSYSCLSNLVIKSNTEIYGDGPGSTVISFWSTAATDNIGGYGVSNVIVRNLALLIPPPNELQQPSGTVIGVVAFHANSTFCMVSNCVISGLNGVNSCGVLLEGSSNCVVSNNSFVNFVRNTSTPSDLSDIRIRAVEDGSSTYECSFNVVENNQCFGGGDYGIALEASAPMLKNVIQGNRVGAHSAYGILLYSKLHGDTYNQVLGNYVEGVLGDSYIENGAAGAGIYVAGMGAVTIANNVITNCCRLTTNNSAVDGRVGPSMESPGGIGINAYGCSSITITGNSIFDMAQGNTSGAIIAGIYISAAPRGTTVSGNTVSQQRGQGLVAGIFIASGNANLTITGNNINILPSLSNVQRGILLYAGGGNIQNVTVSGNTILGCSARGISLEAAEGYGVQVFSICGNVVSGGGATTVPLYLAGGRFGSVSGNSCNASGAEALYVNGSTNVVYSANMLISSGRQTVGAAGTCTGSIFDESNSVNGVIDSSAMGLNVRQIREG
jgi:hypothetical protein